MSGGIAEGGAKSFRKSGSLNMNGRHSPVHEPAGDVGDTRTRLNGKRPAPAKDSSPPVRAAPPLGSAARKSPGKAARVEALGGGAGGSSSSSSPPARRRRSDTGPGAPFGGSYIIQVFDQEEKEQPQSERDPEALAMAASEDRNVASSVGSSSADGDGYAALRQGLEELRQRQKVDQQRKQKLWLRAKADKPVQQPDADCVLGIVRRAIRKDSWAPVISPDLLLKPKTMQETVNRLPTSEAVASLRALASLYTEHPSNERERGLISMWIKQILKLHSLTLQKIDLKPMRPLLIALSRKLGAARYSGKVLAVLGKWRLVHGLATAREKAAAASKPRRAAKAPAAGEDSEEDDDEGSCADDDAADEEDDINEADAMEEDSDQ
eukprot:gnl/TRDRNA2_/TRDRNA2_157819_c0_seq2.p1 gnl/TRDRNA2_/TRDRNA2_157819_c0~~gnl/TRDRNA2_/TRDRNA2_157819_c0_seq2.p1  ORF type:complete len:380 (-),score=85.11 gnl/TRDRNA2_/TRDRNA2_157819_c0_seq2:55-1194(-)